MSNSFPHLNATLAAHRLFALAGADPQAWGALKAIGVNLDLVTKLAGPMVRKLVQFLPDSLFDYDYFGETAFIMAVHNEDPNTVIDLLAWSPRDVATFGTLFGASILGLDHLVNPASYTNGPCCLYSNPLAWLRADCAGAVVLDPAKAKTALNLAPGPLTTDTLDLAEGLIWTGIIPARRLFVPSSWRVVT